MKIIQSLLLTALLPLSAQAQQSPATVARPPQFVMLAFDGSLNLDFWRESRGFAQSMKQQGKPLNFTYFMSGVYFLSREHRQEYDCPIHGIGKSSIGFGGETSNLPYRAEQVNMAIEEGHEMGTHVNGHFDAGAEHWTEADWRSEFTQFYHLIFDMFAINKVQPLKSRGWLLKREDIIGFRAPMLGTTPGLWPTLPANGIKYDTSRTDRPNYWPAKNSFGTWNFPLAEIPIVGTARHTLSMDYNFFFTQSGGKEDAANKQLYKTQMLESYRKYFQDNYNGNRAPVNIGHHFAKWNGGAYWEAMQEFASDVCGLPEVKCVTYKEYMNWLESQTPAQLAAYKQARFPKMAPVRLTSNIPLPSVSVNLIANLNLGKVVAASPASAKVMGPYTKQISVNGDVMGSGELDFASIRDLVDTGDNAEIKAALVNQAGVVVASSTRQMLNVGTPSETLSQDQLEDRALMGDMAEAHMGETEGTPEP